MAKASLGYIDRAWDNLQSRIWQSSWTDQ